MKCPRTFSLLRAKVLNFVNKQSTILCAIAKKMKRKKNYTMIEIFSMHFLTALFFQEQFGIERT